MKVLSSKRGLTWEEKPRAVEVVRGSTLRPAAVFACLAVLLGALAAPASGASPSRVLLLHSFGRDYAPFDVFSETFRTALAQKLHGAVVFYDIDLESAQLDGGEPEGPFTSYLVELFTGRQPDLLVPIGGPATRFAQKYRARLFPMTPMVIAATDQRHIQSAGLTTNDTAVAVVNDHIGTIENILQLLPATTNIVMLIGNSPHERFWREQMRHEFDTLTNRVSFVWFNECSFPEMEKRAAALPPRSAIFFALLYVDAAGVPYPGQGALSDLHAVANAPIFGSHDTQMGCGIVGGPLMPIEHLARNTAGVAARILRGEPAGSIKTPPQSPGPPVYDWRELRRWGISEASLPTASIIRFRQSTRWEHYQWWILLAFVAACGGVSSVFYHQRLKSAKLGHAAFTRELILSQESERKRIASELHDSLGQDLLLIKNRLGLLAAGVKQLPQVTAQLRELLVAASRAIADVRSISQALRPAALEQVGLSKAIEWMIEQLDQASVTKFSSEIDNIDGLLTPELEMNLYRIVQEALNNVIKHAQATRVIVSVKRGPSGISVSIQDDGRGLNPQSLQTAPSRHERKPTLGLVSMAERAKLLAGEIEIQSAQGKGTRLTLTLPLPPLEKNGKTQMTHVE